MAILVQGRGVVAKSRLNDKGALASTNVCSTSLRICISSVPDGTLPFQSLHRPTILQIPGYRADLGVHADLDQLERPIQDLVAVSVSNTDTW